MNPQDFPPNWLLTYFILGWLLGVIAVRDWRWAALCGLAFTLATVFVWHGQALPFAGLTPLLLLAVLGLLILWGIGRLPRFGWRVGLAVLVVPPVARVLLNLGGLLFITLFQIP